MGNNQVRLIPLSSTVLPCQFVAPSAVNENPLAFAEHVKPCTSRLAASSVNRHMALYFHAYVSGSLEFLIPAFYAAS